MRVVGAIAGILLIIAAAITFAIGEWTIGLICAIVGLVLICISIPQLIESALETLFD